MKEVIIHIGSPKTATSSIQGIFARNRAELLEGRVAYPKLCRHGDAHHLLVCDLIEKYRGTKMPDFWYGDKPRGQAWAKFHEEVTELGDSIDKVFISSELFFAQTQNSKNILAAIKEELKNYSVKILIYLRRQDQLYASFYNQDVKGMRQWCGTPESFYQTHQLFKKSYFEIVELWAEFFGSENIHLRPFFKGGLVGEDIVKDVCAAVGCAELKGEGVNENDALGVNQLYIKRCLNRVGFAKEKNEEVLKILTGLLPEPPAKNVLYISAPHYRALKKEWEQCNIKLQDKYLKSTCPYLDRIPQASDIEKAEVSDQLLVEFSTLLGAAIRDSNLGEHAKLFSKATTLLLLERGLTARVSDGTWRILTANCR